jgi:hypothetical protein
LSIVNPLPGWNSGLAQYSHTPSLRVTGFEDEDEYEATGERGVIIFHLPSPREEAYRGEFL